MGGDTYVNGYCILYSAVGTLENAVLVYVCISIYDYDRYINTLWIDSFYSFVARVIDLIERPREKINKLDACTIAFDWS